MSCAELADDQCEWTDVTGKRYEAFRSSSCDDCDLDGDCLRCPIPCDSIGRRDGIEISWREMNNEQDHALVAEARMKETK